jgi:6-phosphogluconolactonase/glucosamine-6-phosphate isomerase/deaminase
MASGAKKAPIVAKVLAGAPHEEVPAARLVGHPGLQFFLDKDAAGSVAL